MSASTTSDGDSPSSTPPGAGQARPADAPLFAPASKRRASSGGGWVVGGLVAVLLVGLVAAGVVFGPRLMAGRGLEPGLFGRGANVTAARPVARPTAPAPAPPPFVAAAPEPAASATPPEPTPPTEVGRLTAEIERLMIERYAAQAGEQARAVQAAEAAALTREQALQARLDAAEAALQAQRASSAAAAGELTALVDAAFSDRPFVPQAAALVRRLPGNADAEMLLALSAQGAPSRAGLADAFERVDAAAARASRRPGGSWREQLLHALTGGAVLRRTDAAASGGDGALARAAARVRAGDLAGAATELERGPPAVAQASAAWRDAVRRRLEIDRRAAAVRDAALSQAAAPVPLPGAAPQAPAVGPAAPVSPPITSSGAPAPTPPVGAPPLSGPVP